MIEVGRLQHLYRERQDRKSNLREEFIIKLYLISKLALITSFLCFINE